eukprot:m.87299 g.87299  ORF g.87299 m.87299 type:complete len:193 (+) comp36540_c0_seq9:838-1416(+)
MVDENGKSSSAVQRLFHKDQILMSAVPDSGLKTEVGCSPQGSPQGSPSSMTQSIINTYSRKHCHENLMLGRNHYTVIAPPDEHSSCFFLLKIIIMRIRDTGNTRPNRSPVNVLPWNFIYTHHKIDTWLKCHRQETVRSVPHFRSSSALLGVFPQIILSSNATKGDIRKVLLAKPTTIMEEQHLIVLILQCHN